jgi:hypothetical protein
MDVVESMLSAHVVVVLATIYEFNGLAELTMDNSIMDPGSVMPCTSEALNVLRKSNVFVAPSKAASAGGVRIWIHGFTLQA